MPGDSRAKGVARWLHRWIGLVLGFVFVVLALSGSLLIFQPAYFAWAHGDILPDGLADEAGSVDAWLANAAPATEGLMGPMAIWRPQTSHNVSDAAMLVYFGNEPGGLGNMGLVAAMMDPGSDALLGLVDIDRTPAYAPLFLHRDLWGGEAGRVASGVVAILSLIALGLGLWLWWPGRGRLVEKLSPRPWRRTLTNVARLHDWSGVWTLVALLVLVATGLCLVQPDWVEPAFAVLPEEHVEEPAGDCGAPIGYDEAIARGEALVPGGDWTAIYADQETAGRLWHIGFAREGDRDPVHGDTWVTTDLGCGKVWIGETLAGSPRHATEVWVSGLHDGTVFGLAGEIVVALLGLVVPVLWVTGLLQWLKKRSSPVARRRREAARAQAAEGRPAA